jgi:hypothetical protein
MVFRGRTSVRRYSSTVHVCMCACTRVRTCVTEYQGTQLVKYTVLEYSRTPYHGTYSSTSTSSKAPQEHTHTCARTRVRSRELEYLAGYQRQTENSQLCTTAPLMLPSSYTCTAHQLLPRGVFAQVVAWALSWGRGVGQTLQLRRGLDSTP